ncbi:NEW3 domain-containing protein, partial [Halobacterium sp. CBA1126]|uniref:COG1470 family protein n=1 Tax=Halobacterium sp. CBA1126 TaxID=2668074 RepID=UPI0012FB5FE8
VAAVLVVSAAGATAIAQPNSPAAEPVADAGDAVEQSDGETNYTRLYVDQQYRSLRLKPGESETVTIAVENGEDESVTLSPHMYVPPRGERPVAEEWVDVGTDDLTLDAGEEREFDVTVSVPEDAELNRYGGEIALTEQTISYPGRPAQPANGVSLSVEVYREPTVRVVSDTYAHSQVQAGDSFTREFVVENTGEQAVPVRPELVTEDRYRPYNGRDTLERSWVEIDAPGEIAPGETATVEVTVTPPSDADRGDYRAELDLGLKDPARPDQSSYWQRVSLRFQVWTQPEQPFRTSFAVSEDAENVTLDLSANRYGSADSEPASFDVTFVAPNGTEVEAERVSVTDHGSVDLAASRQQAATDGAYASGGEHQTFEYRLDDPAAGSWSVEVMPENAMQFSYEITRNEA